MRNALLFRSVGFGLIAKLSGSVVAVLGLPIVAHSITQEDYTLFLKCISVTSLITLAFSSLNIISVRELSGDHSEKALSEKFSQVLGLYLTLLVLCLLILAVAPLAFKTDIRSFQYLFLAGVLTSVQYFLQSGEAYRVSRRIDHISSSITAIGNAVMAGALIYFSKLGLLYVILIYFGIPLLVQLAGAAVVFQRLEISIAFSVDIIKAKFGIAVWNLVNMLVEYAKIFLMGYIVLLFWGSSEYSRYTTLVLLAVRFINPISLIARPFLPAYLDAVEKKDDGWLRNVWRIKAALLLIATLTLSGVSYFFDVGHLASNVSDSFKPSTLDLFFLSLFFVGQLYLALIANIYLTSPKANIYVWINLGSVSCVALFLLASSSKELLSLFMPLGIGVFLGALAVCTYARENIFRASY